MNISTAWQTTRGEIDLSRFLTSESNWKQVIPPFDSQECDTYEALVSNVEVLNLLVSNKIIKEFFIAVSESKKIDNTIDDEAFDMRDSITHIINDDVNKSKMVMKMMFLVRLVKFHRRWIRRWMRYVSPDSVHWKFQYRVLVETVDNNNNLITDELIQKRMIEITRSVKR